MPTQNLKISCEEMVKMVTKEFIAGSDSAFLKKVEKTAKGGGMLNDVGKALHNKNQTFTFEVLKPLFVSMKGKDVVLYDRENDIVYDMDSKPDSPKFYEGIVNAIAKENNK